MNKLYDVVDRLLLESKVHNRHERASAYRHSAAILESALNREQSYKTGEYPVVGDTVQAGGDEFRVDRVDFRAGIVKGAIDPCGYAITACTLIKRG